MATITVLSDINTAPTAGESTMPIDASTPPASGIATKPLREPLPHQAREEIGRAASRDWHDQTHRPHRIALCSRDVRHCRQRGSARGQMQELPAVRKFQSRHDQPSQTDVAATD